jgi:hypothetical protein
MIDRRPLPPPRRRPGPTNADLELQLGALDQRLATVEQLLLRLSNQMTPKYVRVGSWVTIAGSVLGACLKFMMEGK